MDDAPIIGFPAEPNELTESEKAGRERVKTAIVHMESAIQILKSLRENSNITYRINSIENDVRYMKAWVGEEVRNPHASYYDGGPFDGKQCLFCFHQPIALWVSRGKWAVYSAVKFGNATFLGYETSEVKAKKKSSAALATPTP